MQDRELGGLLRTDIVQVATHMIKGWVEIKNASYFFRRFFSPVKPEKVAVVAVVKWVGIVLTKTHLILHCTQGCQSTCSSQWLCAQLRDSDHWQPFYLPQLFRTDPISPKSRREVGPGPSAAAAAVPSWIRFASLAPRADLVSLFWALFGVSSPFRHAHQHLESCQWVWLKPHQRKSHLFKCTFN